jgi:autotransporter-associated beta strand protein
MVNAGTLLANNTMGSGTGTGAVTVNMGGTLGGTGTISGAVSVANGGMLSPGSPVANPGTLGTGNLALVMGATYAVQLNGAGAGQFDQVNVTGTVNLGNATLMATLGAGFSPINGQTFTIINNDGADAVTGTFNGLAQGATVMISGRAFTISYTGGTGNDVVLTAVVATRTWDGGGADNNWMTAANWVGDVAPLPGDNLVFAGAVRTTNNNNFPMNTPFNSITFMVGGFTLNGNAVVLAATGMGTGITNTAGNNTINLPLNVMTNPQTITSTAGALTIAGAVGNGGQLLTVTGAGNTTISGAISGAGGLTKEGAGTLTLSGTNTYTGATTVNAGTVSLAGGMAIADAGAVVLANAAGATLSLSNSNETIGSLAGGGAMGGNVTLGTFTLSAGGNNTDTTYAGVISGSGGLTKQGTGTLTLTGTNTYTGATTIGAGTLLVNGSTAAGSAVAVNMGGTLGGTGTANGAVTVNNGGMLSPGSPAANPGALGTGNLALVMGATYAIQINSAVAFDTVNVTGTVNLGNATLMGTLGGGFIPTNGTTFTIINNDGTDAVMGTFAGLAEGAVVTIGVKTFAITYMGGTGNDVVLTAVPTTRTWDGGGADNNWMTAANWVGDVAPLPGDNLVFAGTVRQMTNNNFAANTDFRSILFNVGGFTLMGNAVQLSSTGPGAGITNMTGDNTIMLGINVMTNAQTITSAAGTLTIAGAVSNGGQLLTVTGAGNTTISGVVSGAGGLTKAGTGSLTLSGANTYTGATTINAGTLLANNTMGSGTGTGAVAVNMGATLGGTGTISGAVSIANGGTLNPGSPAGNPGTLGTGNLALVAGATYVVVLNGTGAGQFDQINVTGTVNLGGSTLNATAGFMAAVGNSFTIINNDGTDAVTGTFAGLAQNAEVMISGQRFRISYTGGDGNDVVLTRVAEPPPIPPPPPISPNPLVNFVTDLYRTILRRNPDAPGLAFWVSKLQGGESSRNVVMGFWNSPEHRCMQVEEYYRRFLNRAPDASGKQEMVNVLLRTNDETRVVIALLTSQEYINSHPTPTAYVQGLYRDVLFREGSASDVAFWVGQLDQQGRQSVALGFYTSLEAFTDLVRFYYRDFLRRAPDPNGQQFWINQLIKQQNGLNDGRSDVAVSFGSSPEFFTKAQSPSTFSG